jgi:hypothetical protein
MDDLILMGNGLSGVFSSMEMPFVVQDDITPGHGGQKRLNITKRGGGCAFLSQIQK